jgi:hypothetical protein
MVEDRTHGAIDGQLLPVDTESGDLSVEVRKVPALQEGIVGEPDSRDDVTCAEGNLLGLGEELVDTPVQAELADREKGNLVNRPDLGGVEDIKVEVVLVLLSDDLNEERPLGRTTALDGLFQILAVEVYCDLLVC